MEILLADAQAQLPARLCAISLEESRRSRKETVADLATSRRTGALFMKRRPMDEEIRQKILTLLDQHRIMSIATLRPDGWPQVTTVGYANEGLTLYFLCGPDSQKAANLARDDRVSLTIDHDTPQVMEITGLSMAARVQVVVDKTEAEKAFCLLMLKYPEQASIPLPMPTPADVRIFRVTPMVISVLDYSKGFAHADLVTY
jgi:nitroimidazol reductase NimA-like FMN-containing flavoprotein (pyridoxamine 5'-phosphate oxidase superfamily)